VDESLDRVLREKDLRAYDGLSRATRRREQHAGRYPKFRKIGPHMVGLLASELNCTAPAV
jgi:predicted DNA-binding transcriptional regulator AlpA